MKEIFDFFVKFIFVFGLIFLAAATAVGIFVLITGHAPEVSVCPTCGR